MKFKLENPQHQITAIHSVMEVFRGMEKNTYDNAHNEDIHSNVCSLSAQELADNIHRVIKENNVPDAQAHLAPGNDACIEMETGTGKTYKTAAIAVAVCDGESKLPSDRKELMRSTRRESSRHVSASHCSLTRAASRNSTCSYSTAARTSEWKSSTSTETASLPDRAL